MTSHDIPEICNKLTSNAMSLPTCPSCGQSVLEDDAVDCTFCGAAMDGSRGAKNTPKPQAGPARHRPGAKPVVTPPTPISNSAVASKPASPTPGATTRPASGAAGSRTKVDEDDPFGIGNASAQAAVQATEKPDKTRCTKSPARCASKWALCQNLLSENQSAVPMKSAWFQFSRRRNPAKIPPHVNPRDSPMMLLQRGKPPRYLNPLNGIRF